MPRFLPLLLVAGLLTPYIVGCGGSSADGEYQEIKAGTISPSAPEVSVAANAERTSDRGDDEFETDPDTDSGFDSGDIQQVAAVEPVRVEGEAQWIDEPPTAGDVDGNDEAFDGPEIVPGERRAVKSLVPAPEFRRERGALRVTFDDLDLNRVIGIDRPTTETPALMPKWQRDLDGQRIRIRGFMYPVFEQVVSSFILTRDNGVCCFGPNAKLYDQISVTLKPGTESEYLQNTPFDVEGTFAIQPYEIDGDVVVYYILEDAVVHRR